MESNDSIIMLVFILLYLFPYAYLYLAHRCNYQIFNNDKYEKLIFIAYLITAFAGVIYLFTYGAT